MRTATRFYGILLPRSSLRRRPDRSTRHLGLWIFNIRFGVGGRFTFHGFLSSHARMIPTGGVLICTIARFHFGICATESSSQLYDYGRSIVLGRSHSAESHFSILIPLLSTLSLSLTHVQASSHAGFFPTGLVQVRIKVLLALDTPTSWHLQRRFLLCISRRISAAFEKLLLLDYLDGSWRRFTIHLIFPIAILSFETLLLYA